jgi:hypothetical protein
MNGANIALRMPIKMNRLLNLQINRSELITFQEKVELTLQSKPPGSWPSKTLSLLARVRQTDTP